MDRADEPMSTIREQIVAAVHTALNTERPAGIPETVRTRVESPGPDALPVLTVYQGREVVSPKHAEKADPGRGERMAIRGDIVNRKVDVNFEVLVKAGKDDPPADQAADPYLAWAVRSIIGAGRFGGLARRPAEEQGTQFSYEQADFSYCRATTTFRIEYQSKTDDAEQLK